MSVPKFYVGQRVVAIRDHSRNMFRKGDQFTITSVKRSSYGCSWDVTIGLASIYSTTQCPYCMCIQRSGIEYVFGEIMFAPIHEDFKKVTFERVVEKELTSAN